MKKGPLISVIVPVYNVVAYLRRCVDSLIGQTYNNLEIILVDDGSTDGSGNLCKQLEQEDDRIRVVRKANGGLSSARNTGLDMAQGQYVCFVDSDDFVSEEFVDCLYRMLSENSAQIAQCNVIKGKNDTFETPAEQKDWSCWEGKVYLRHYFDRREEGLGYCVTKLYDRRLFDQIRFPDGRVHEDVATVYRLLYQAKKIVRTKRRLYYYYMRDESIMRGNFGEKRLDWLLALEEKLTFLSEKGETALYNRSLQEYNAVLLKLYYCMKRYLPAKKEKRSEILVKSRRTYRALLPKKEIAGYAKILFTAGYLCPYAVGGLLHRII